MFTDKDIKEAQAAAIILAYWMIDDYVSLLKIVQGESFEWLADTHFYAREIADNYSYRHIGTTPYEVSMWLRKKIEETK